MTFLPIVERELCVAARRRRTYWLRVIEGSVAVAVCAFGVVTNERFNASTSAAGHSIFEILSWLGLAYVLLLGIVTTSDSLSRERREGTLGLLFLTDLKGYDVVLGKLAASSLAVSYGLLAMLPVLAVPLMLGGVTMAEFARVAVVWVTAQLLSLSCGLVVSSVSRDERNAAGGAFSLLAGVTLLVPMVGVLVSMKMGGNEIARGFLYSSPLFACWSAFSTGFRAPTFWISVVTIQLLSWCFLALACRASRRVGDGIGAPSFRTRWHERWRRCRQGTPQARLAYRRKALEVNPLLWLLTRDRMARTYPWLFLFAMLAIWLWGYSMERTMIGLESTLVIGFLTHLIFKLWVANSACYGFAEERAAGALELLFSTPLREREFLRGPGLAIRHLLARPVAVAVGAEIILLMTGAFRPPIGSETARLLFMNLTSIGLLFVDTWALYWVGMFAGLRAPRPQNAVWLASGVVLLGPWLCVWGSATLLPQEILGESGTFAAIIWLAFSLFFDLALGLWARFTLESDLRELALHRFVERQHRVGTGSG